MKKTLLLASVLAFTLAPSLATTATTATTTQKAATVESATPQKMEHKKPSAEAIKRKAEFEKRLNLTDEQKAKAKLIHEQGRTEIKPIMDKIQAKRKEIEAVKLSKIAEQEQKAKIEQLHKEIGALKRHANELRMKNMKDFEAILTKKQLKELKKMKEEGRKNFDKEFKKNHQQGPGYRPMPPECKKGHGPRPFGPSEPPIE